MNPCPPSAQGQKSRPGGRVRCHSDMGHGVARPPTPLAPELSPKLLARLPKAQAAFLGSGASGRSAHCAWAREAGAGPSSHGHDAGLEPCLTVSTLFAVSMVFERSIVLGLTDLFQLLLCTPVGLAWARVGLTSRELPELRSAASVCFTLKDLVPFSASHSGP